MQESNFPTKRKEGKQCKHKNTVKITSGSNHDSLISLDMNRLNSSMKRPRLTNILYSFNFILKNAYNSFFNE